MKTDSQVGMPYLPSPLNPPKRCHSWNGLAELASSTPSSPESSTTAVKHRKGLRAARPRSLNLSLSNISVPTAVLQLNAQVQSSLPTEAKHMRSSSDIPRITEELEMSASGSETSLNNSTTSTLDLSTSINTNTSKTSSSFNTAGKTGSSSHTVKTLTLPLHTASVDSDSRSSSRYESDYIKSPAVSELSASQPSLSTPSPSDLLPDIKCFVHELSSINWTPAARFNITPARTAPSDLDKSGSNVTARYGIYRRRSRSLENLISPEYDELSAPVCMKCGRADRGNICHRFSGSVRPGMNVMERPSPLCGSSEMIQVS